MPYTSPPGIEFEHGARAGEPAPPGWRLGGTAGTAFLPHFILHVPEGRATYFTNPMMHTYDTCILEALRNYTLRVTRS